MTLRTVFGPMSSWAALSSGPAAGELLQRPRLAHREPIDLRAQRLGHCFATIRHEFRDSSKK